MLYAGRSTSYYIALYGAQPRRNEAQGISTALKQDRFLRNIKSFMTPDHHFELDSVNPIAKIRCSKTGQDNPFVCYSILTGVSGRISDH